MPASLDTIMEDASLALAKMDYLTGEATCLKALSLASEQRDWAYYGRILLPLQECRRQRRMIAAEGVVRLGTADLTGAAESWLGDLPEGCIVLTHPHSREDARRLQAAARDRQHHVEVLFADNEASASRWKLCAFTGPSIEVEVAAPPAAWRNAWLRPGAVAEKGAKLPADWFVDATEKLGDALLARVTTENPRQRIAELEACLAAMSDHEILHQRLADAARDARLAAASAAAGSGN
ncbi:MAG: hypothetical protein WD768_22050 [Phycisphaeraceae bacterium]